jgi:succinate dehydrogenase / fumarate reductase cytochrome b subunit
MRNRKPDTRPVFLNLLKIRQPITAVASIAHRIAGVILVMAIPLLIWHLDHALATEAGYYDVLTKLSTPLGKIGLLVMGWALLHHILAGLRFILLDLDIGIELASARASAYFVTMAAALGLVLMVVFI